jgi:transketolase
VLDTLMGKGVRIFEQREKNHFIRVEPSEWQIAREQLEANAPSSGRTS